jgi:two-component system cell cycle response regulator CtrA
MIVHSFLPDISGTPLSRVSEACSYIGMEFASHLLKQEVASALYRDPDSMAIVWALSSHSAVKLVRQWRLANITNPIFVLLAEDAAFHTAFAAILNAGADDVQQDGISMREIAARLDVLQRRERCDDPRIMFADCTFHPGTGIVASPLGQVSLTRYEAKILVALIDRKGFVLTKEHLLDRLYSADEPDLKIIDVFICKLRKKLAAIHPQPLVETVWGRGYRFLSEHTQGVAAE